MFLFLKTINFNGMNKKDFNNKAIDQGIGNPISTKNNSVNIAFSQRKKEYINFYKLDENDPGLMFILKQIIQNEFQEKKYWQSWSCFPIMSFEKNVKL